MGLWRIIRWLEESVHEDPFPCPGFMVFDLHCSSVSAQMTFTQPDS